MNYSTKGYTRWNTLWVKYVFSPKVSVLFPKLEKSLTNANQTGGTKHKVKRSERRRIAK